MRSGGDHADANVLIIDGRGHELVDSRPTRFARSRATRNGDAGGTDQAPADVQGGLLVRGDSFIVGE